MDCSRMSMTSRFSFGMPGFERSDSYWRIELSSRLRSERADRIDDLVGREPRLLVGDDARFGARLAMRLQTVHVVARCAIAETDVAPIRAAALILGHRRAALHECDDEECDDGAKTDHERRER